MDAATIGWVLFAIAGGVVLIAVCIWSVFWLGIRLVVTYLYWRDYKRSEEHDSQCDGGSRCVTIYKWSKDTEITVPSWRTLAFGVA